MDPKTGYCYGCGRNDDEKRIWKLDETTEEWKTTNIETIKKRLTGWQLESFEESYQYKIKNGISLFNEKGMRVPLFFVNFLKLNFFI